MKISKERVIRACKVRHKTRTELARQLQLDYSTVQRFLRKGETITDYVDWTSQFLDASPAWIAGEIGNNRDVLPYDYVPTEEEKKVIQDARMFYRLEKQALTECGAFREYLRTLGFGDAVLKKLSEWDLRQIERESRLFINEMFLTVGLQEKPVSEFLKKYYEQLPYRIKAVQEVFETEEEKEVCKHGENQKEG